jgi:dipeptidyl-peptidase III
MSKHIKEETPL